MAFDLMVGTEWRVKDQPSMVGTIEFDELPQLSRLLKRQDCFFCTASPICLKTSSFRSQKSRRHWISYCPC